MPTATGYQIRGGPRPDSTAASPADSALRWGRRQCRGKLLTAPLLAIYITSTITITSGNYMSFSFCSGRLASTPCLLAQWTIWVNPPPPDVFNPYCRPLFYYVWLRGRKGIGPGPRGDKMCGVGREGNVCNLNTNHITQSSPLCVFLDFFNATR